MDVSLNATYRLQLNQTFPLKNATEILEYLNQLGISHCYFSPILQAKKDSMHGYDVIDHRQLNTDLGTEQQFLECIQDLKEKKMGLIVDIVPNHIFIGNCENFWWRDVLEKGPYSPYASFFDIDWHPPKKTFENKIFLPILNEPFGTVLENQLIKVEYEKGNFLISLPHLKLPTDPKSWILILQPLYFEVEKLLKENNACVDELKNLILSLSQLPQNDARNYSNYEEIKKGLQILLSRYPAVHDMLMKQLFLLNGIKGNPNSFNHLETFLDYQYYRLCYWKVANDEINYRRFFDILDYAAIREEQPEVFEAAHALILSYIKKGWIQGLRVDHIDGLNDPQRYLEDLQTNASKALTYLIVEKILTGNESLQKSWPIQGSVGYDFLNQLNSVFVYQDHKAAFLEIYHTFTGLSENSAELKYQCKKLILNTVLSSELHLLARRLERLAENHRDSQDFTSESLKNALIEIMASFPVYRSYIRKGEIHEEDRKYIIVAVARAKKFNPSIDFSVYQFIQSILLQELHNESSEFKINCLNFALHFQQVSGPVMAKGVEDTAFYRYFPLASLCEVGGDPGFFGVTVENFHKMNLERWEFFPTSMLATTTHDTKRSEDVRARMNVLSEIPDEWKKTVNKWHQINKSQKTNTNEEEIPDKNDEYLLYQTLIGTWPLEDIDNDLSMQTYTQRISDYMMKVIKEAKIHCSWVNPNEEYETGVKNFIQKILDKNSNEAFLDSLNSFCNRIQDYGMLNSLSQILIKFTSPGIPDLYQGNEIWDFSLVDPDNRRAVDFIKRKELLDSLDAACLNEYLKSPKNGKIKLFITQQTLRLRRSLPDLFTKGCYLPLSIAGPKENHLIAFARALDEKIVIVIASRFFTFLMKDFSSCSDGRVWKETFVEVPIEFTKRKFKDIYTADELVLDSLHVPLERVFSKMPFAVLVSLN